MNHVRSTICFLAVVVTLVILPRSAVSSCTDINTVYAGGYYSVEPKANFLFGTHFVVPLLVQPHSGGTEIVLSHSGDGENWSATPATVDTGGTLTTIPDRSSDYVFAANSTHVYAMASFNVWCDPHHKAKAAELRAQKD